MRRKKHHLICDRCIKCFAKIVSHFSSEANVSRDKTARYGDGENAVETRKATPTDEAEIKRVINTACIVC